MSPTSPLPAGWMKILEDIQMRLDHAIAETSARLDETPVPAPSDSLQTRHDEVARWQDRFGRLSAYLESADQVVQSVDEILQREEDHFRKHLAVSESLRQRLAK